MNKSKQTAVFLFCIMFASTNFIAALSQPIMSPVIVTFGNTEAEIASTRILQTEFPNAITVQYGSLEYFLVKGRCFGSMVFVGHGSGDGIGNVNALSIIQDIKTSPTPHTYLLACGSNEIAEIDPSLGIIGFDQIIDAEIGALIVALRIALSLYMVQKVESIFDQFLQVARNKINGHQQILPLAYLSNAERDHFLSAMLLSIGIAVIGTFVFSALAQKFSLAARAAASAAESGLKTSVKNAVIYFATHGGIGSILTGINVLFGGVIVFATQLGPSFVNMINIAVSSLDIFEFALWLALTAAEIALIVITASMSLWYRIGSSLVVAITNIGLIGIADYLDSDGTPSTSLFEVISQLT